LQLAVILLAVHWKTNTHKVLQLTVKLRLTHCNTACLQLSCFWNARVLVIIGIYTSISEFPLICGDVRLMCGDVWWCAVFRHSPQKLIWPDRRWRFDGSDLICSSKWTIPAETCLY